jgi:hypothetical protein
MMNLSPDKLTTCKLNTIELREIKGGGQLEAT